MAVTYAFTNPSVSGPYLRFNDGTVVNNQESYNPATTPGGTPSPDWDITQWASPEYLNPLTPIVYGSSDPVLGPDIFRYASSTGDSAVDVFGTPGDYTYRLTGKNGELQDTYLQTLVGAPGSFTFDKTMILTLDERLSAVYGVQNSGPTMAQNDVTVNFNVPGSAIYDASLPTLSAFLQFPIADSRGEPGPYADSDGSPGGTIYNVAPWFNNTDEALPWESDTGPLHAVTIDLNKSIEQMISWMQSSGIYSSVGPELNNLEHWQLGGFYAGIEAFQGNGASLDIKNVQISRDDSKTYSDAASPGPAVSVQGGVYYNGAPVGWSPPLLEQQTGDLRVYEGQSFSLSVPSSTFSDPNRGVLTYSVSSTDGSALPPWMTFNPDSGTLSGTAPASEAAVSVMVVAAATDGTASAEAFHVYTSIGYPVLRQQTDDLRIAEHTAFSFALPAAAFSDPAGGSVTYAARQVDGSALPSWLSFNASDGVFTGTTPGASVLSLRVDATSSEGISSAEAFKIYSSPALPQFSQQTADDRITAGQSFSFTLAQGTFTDPDGGAVSYAASSADGSALPSWMTFNPATGLFSGTAPASATATAVRIDATTSEGGTAAEAFHIYSNPPPVLNQQAQDGRFSAGQQFTMTLPADSFSDPGGGSVSYSARQVDGSELPSWLTFDAVADQFSGTGPSTGAALGVRVDAATTEGTVAAEAFHIYVKAAPPTFVTQAEDDRLSPGQAFTFNLPQNSFTDPAGGAVSYSAEQVDGSALPAWISFNSATSSFSGVTPSASSQAVLGVRVDATTAAGGTAAEAFHIYYPAPSAV